MQQAAFRRAAIAITIAIGAILALAPAAFGQFGPQTATVAVQDGRTTLSISSSAANALADDAQAAVQSLLDATLPPRFLS